jgi:hypothetical protein
MNAAYAATSIALLVWFVAIVTAVLVGLAIYYWWRR